MVGLADTPRTPLRRLGVSQVHDEAMRFLQSVEPALEHAWRPRYGVVWIDQARRAVARQRVDQCVSEVDDWQFGVDRHKGKGARLGSARATLALALPGHQREHDSAQHFRITGDGSLERRARYAQQV